MISQEVVAVWVQCDTLTCSSRGSSNTTGWELFFFFLYKRYCPYEVNASSSLLISSSLLNQIQQHVSVRSMLPLHRNQPRLYLMHLPRREVVGSTTDKALFKTHCPHNSDYRIYRSWTRMFLGKQNYIDFMKTFIIIYL